MSKEHFWPAWANDLLPDSVQGHEEALFTFVEKVKLYGEPFKRKRQGGVKGKRVKAVCRKCNSEWMGALEEKAQPILTPIILGRSVTLTPEMQKIIIEWITLKIMVGEHNHPDTAVFSQANRTAFYKDRTIPPGLLIRIGYCGWGGWRSGYIRHSSTLSLTPNPPPDFTARNIQTTTFGIGNLLVFAAVQKVDGFRFEDFLRFGAALHSLWPSGGGNIIWPFRLRILEADATRLAMAFDNFTKQPQVRWRSGP